MKLLKTTILLIVLSALAFACEKEKIVTVEKEVPAPVPATITINSPIHNDTIKHGATVHLKAVISGINTLHGYDFSLVAGHHDVFRKHVHGHDKNFYVDTTWVNNVTAPTSVTFKVETSLDHHGNSIGKSITFYAE